MIQNNTDNADAFSTPLYRMDTCYQQHSNWVTKHTHTYTHHMLTYSNRKKSIETRVRKRVCVCGDFLYTYIYMHLIFLRGIWCQQQWLSLADHCLCDCVLCEEICGSKCKMCRQNIIVTWICILMWSKHTHTLVSWVAAIYRNMGACRQFSSEQLSFFHF